MYTICYSIHLFCLTVLEMVQAEYLPINWNISTDRGNSHIEREYKYPMYQEVAPAPCDLTDACDVFCPQDSDCNEAQKLSFADNKSETRCEGPLSVYDCNCHKFEKPEWLSVFCYVYKNPIYLGKFFKTQEKIEKISTLKNLIHNKRQNLFKNQQNDGKVKGKIVNQYGSPIMTFVPSSESFPSVSPLLNKVPLRDFSFACKSKPIAYGFNTSIVCLTKVTPKLCQNGYVLSILPHLVQGGNISADSNIPIVMNDLSILKGIKTEVKIKCVELKSKIKKCRNKEMNYFQEKNVKSCDESITMHQTLYENNMCKNVLIYILQDFVLNGSDIVKLKVEYGLTDIPVHDNDLFIDIIPKYIFLKQRFSVRFFDVLSKPNDRKNFSRNEELLNRGYFVGEELNFGYKHTENSSTSWQRGILGVFKSGYSCDNVAPIAFGFDYFSVCQMRKKFQTCSQLRTVAEKKLDALLQGDSLAVYSNLRAPYNSTVPLLRSYANSSQENSTGCSVPTVQDVRIQYTSVFTVSGKPVHRVLGVRIDRLFRNFSINEDVSLTCRVFFSYVSSSERKTMSRFWQRMFSQELSENSWLHIFNAFDDVTPREREEITFWCILLLLFSSVAVAWVKLDVSFEFFFI